MSSLADDPFAQLTLNGVATFEGCVQAGDDIGHDWQDASKTCEAARISRISSTESAGGLVGPRRPIDPDEEHWHGAAPWRAGEHLAINTGAETSWLESSA